FAGILAMLMAPFCVKLESWGVHNGIASFLCILLLLLFFAGIAGLLSTQIANFRDDLPKIEQHLNKQLQSIQELMHERFGISPEQQKQAVKDGSPEDGKVGSMIVSFLNSLTGILANVVLVLVYMFLLLYYRSRFPTFITKVVSEHQKERARHIIAESSRVAQQYMIGRGILILILTVCYSIGLALAGLYNAIFLSLIAALLSIIPYIGNMISLALFLLMAMAQGGGGSLYITIFIVVILTQFIESYLLQPLIVEHRVDIHPFFTVVIIIIGWLLWGIPGMILAIPLLGMVKIVFSHIKVLEPYAYLIGDTRDTNDAKPSERIKHWFGISS